MDTSVQKMDSLGKILIPNPLRRLVDLGKPTEVDYTADYENQTLTIKSNAPGTLNIDELGRVNLPKELRDKLGFITESKQSFLLTADVTNSSITIKLES